MKKSLSLIKFLGAGFLSLGAISISAAAINHNKNQNNKEVVATGKDSYWSSWISANASTIEKGGKNFVTALKTKITQVQDGNDNIVGYDSLWGAYKTSDPVPGSNGSYIWDTYGGFKYAYQSGGKTSYGEEGAGYNREHSVPKSWFGSAKPAYSDLIHLLPTDGYVNAQRSNYTFGEVSSASYTYPYTAQSYGGVQYQNAGSSKLGSPKKINDVDPGVDKVFEPDDQYKGDFARIYMYFAVRYGGGDCQATKNEGSTIFTSTLTDDNPYMTNYGLALMQKWHVQDKVSEKEISRNNAIETLQNNRNPFVDYPEWADKIFGTNYSGDTPSTDPTITISPTSLTLTEGGSTSTITATISNGSGNVTWESSDEDVVTVSSDGTNETTCTVTPVAAGTATITASYSTATPVTCSVTVNSSGGGGGGDDPVNDVLFAKGFGGYTTGSYSAAGTDYSGLANSTNNSNSTYAMQVFNGSTGAVRGNQSGASNFSIRNTTTYSDHYVSSVSLTVSGGTLDGSTSGRSVVYFGTSAYSNPNTTAPSGTSTTASPASSGQATLTWTNTDTTKNYFILYNLKTSGVALSENASTALTVTWSPVSGGDDPTLTGITIKTTPTKTTYTSGETFSPTNLVITANYSDSSYDTDVSYAGHTSDFTFSPSLNTALKTNNDKVTITYGGKSADQAIIVNPSSITASPKKDTYYVGETISAEDITVTDNDGFDVTGFTFSPSSYQFVYGDSSAGGVAKNKTFTNAVSYANKTANVTFSVNRQAYVEPSSTQEVTDTITSTNLPATTTSYVDFSDVEITSDAKYAGNSAKDASGNIQLRSKNSDSGLVSTTSGGTIKSVKITVGSGSNTIDVYGKNAEYTDATDLYNSSKQGTKVGSLSATGTITFTSDYTYVGIRSNNGAVYISSIEITYKGSSGQDNALNVSNFIMYEDTNNQCNTKLGQAITKLNTMPKTEKDLFWTPGNNYVISTAKTRLQAWATSKGKTLTYEDGEYSVDGAKFNIMFKHTESSSLTLILIMISITSTMIGFIFVGYYLKKKER